MKNAWPILLLLAGCGSHAGTDANGADALPPELTPNMEAVEANSAAHVQAMIDKALPAVLPDAKSAQYRNIRAGGGGSVCGEVSGKTTPGFVAFVVTPAGVPLLGTASRIAYEDPSDFLADAWVRWCATPEELKSVAAIVQKAKPGDGVGNIAISLPEPVPAIPTLPDAPPPKPGPPPPPPQIGSFFNSVQHKQ